MDDLTTELLRFYDLRKEWLACDGLRDRAENHRLRCMMDNSAEEIERLRAEMNLPVVVNIGRRFGSPKLAVRNGGE